MARRPGFHVERPIQNGVIKDFGKMEELMQHMFDKLRVAPQEHPILLTEATLNKMAHREKLAQVTLIVIDTFSALVKKDV